VKVVAVSRILVWYGVARELSMFQLGCRTRARRGEARYERHPKYESVLVVENILNDVLAWTWEYGRKEDDSIVNRLGSENKCRPFIKIKKYLALLYPRMMYVKSRD